MLKISTGSRHLSFLYSCSNHPRAPHNPSLLHRRFPTPPKPFPLFFIVAFPPLLDPFLLELANRPAFIPGGAGDQRQGRGHSLEDIGEYQGEGEKNKEKKTKRKDREREADESINLPQTFRTTFVHLPPGVPPSSLLPPLRPTWLSVEHKGARYYPRMKIQRMSSPDEEVLAGGVWGGRNGEGEGGREGGRQRG